MLRSFNTTLLKVPHLKDTGQSLTCVLGTTNINRPRKVLLCCLSFRDELLKKKRSAQRKCVWHKVGLLHPCIDSFVLEAMAALQRRALLEVSLPAGVDAIPPPTGGHAWPRGCHFLISYGDTLLPGSMTRLPAPSRACPIARHPSGAGRPE